MTPVGRIMRAHEIEQLKTLMKGRTGTPRRHRRHIHNHQPQTTPKPKHKAKRKKKIQNVTNL